MSGGRFIAIVLQGERMGRKLFLTLFHLGMILFGKLIKLGPLPIKIGLAAQYMVHHPDYLGQKWNIQLSVTPVIPNLIKATLFD